MPIKARKYYYPNANLPYGGNKGFINFNVEECEQCSKEVLAPNSFTINEPEHVLVSLGCTKKRPPNEEIGYCEITGGSVCPDCCDENNLEREEKEVECLKDEKNGVYPQHWDYSN